LRKGFQPVAILNGHLQRLLKRVENFGMRRFRERTQQLMVVTNATAWLHNSLWIEIVKLWIEIVKKELLSGVPGVHVPRVFPLG
jgi:hypothetical protein